MAILSQNLNDALNMQVLIEYGNEIKYAQIQSYFEDLQLKKLASFFKNQAKGENDHANLFMNHINDRNGGKVNLGEVEEPNLNLADINSVADVFIRIEQDTTSSIEELYDMALSEKSFIDLPFLQSMLLEQVEEEDISQRVATNLKMTNDIVLFDATFEV
jgi:ferritin